MLRPYILAMAMMMCQSLLSKFLCQHPLGFHYIWSIHYQDDVTNQMTKNHLSWVVTHISIRGIIILHDCSVTCIHVQIPTGPILFGLNTHICSCITMWVIYTRMYMSYSLIQQKTQKLSRNKLTSTIQREHFTNSKQGKKCTKKQHHLICLIALEHHQPVRISIHHHQIMNPSNLHIVSTYLLKQFQVESPEEPKAGSGHL